MKKAEDTRTEWEDAYGGRTFRHKNEYPNTEIVSFIMGNFGGVKDKSKVRILDLGCGWGNNLKLLKDKGFQYHGIDFSKTAVRHCRRRFKNVIWGDISKLPYEENFFDCVFDRGAIQHNPREKIIQIFAEVNRVLKPGGLFYSMLHEKAARMDFYTTYLTKTEIRAITKKFSEIRLDYLEFTKNNAAEVYRVNVITARK